MSYTESKLLFVSRIEFIRSRLPFFSAHVTLVHAAAANDQVRRVGRMSMS